MTLQRAEKWAYYLAYAYVLYMPLHIFLSQSLSVVTGGLDVWKAAKDIVLVFAVFPLLFIAYKQGALKNKYVTLFAGLGAAYVVLYFLFLLFATDLDKTSTITAAVYNTRILGYFLLGFVVASAKESKRYVRSLTKALLIMCGVVATLGVLQYFLPKDLLTHVGYSLERGMKPMFFIDDKPDFPRVMSTLRDPNSLGAFLSLPILYAVTFLRSKKDKRKQMVGTQKHMVYLLAVSLACLLLTFSRSGVVTLVFAGTALVVLTTKNKRHLLRRYAPLALVGVLVIVSLFVVFRNTYTVKNLIFHADESSAELDPNELRVSFGKQALAHIQKYPFGEGPGTAGLVAISNPKGGVLTENYYLQIAYEVGVVGLLLFVAVSGVVMILLYKQVHGSSLALVVFCSGVGIAAFGMLNHSWSNESLAFVWWFSAGLAAVPRVTKSS
jgi:O-antigen ligase